MEAVWSWEDTAWASARGPRRWRRRRRGHVPDAV